MKLLKDFYSLLKKVSHILAELCIILIKGYQRYISPIKGPTCRFYPTCSEYSAQAFRKYGFFKGMFLTIVRVGKCHPFHPGGYDPLK